jgi:putative transposase
MPSKTKKAAAAANAAQLHIPAEWLDQLVTGPMTAGQVQELFDQFNKAVLERALAVYLTTLIRNFALRPHPLGGGLPQSTDSGV